MVPTYIDPGTGSMLFTMIIGLVSAGVYALRGLIIKARFVLSGGRQEEKTGKEIEFAIFSDDKRYWNVFEPICDEFERRGRAVSFMTASPNDPALEKSYKHVRCEFIGENNKAFARLNMLKADIVLSSTPGLDVYQWKRSRDVKWYVHVFHTVSDPVMYRMFGIDYYDTVLFSGEYQVAQIRELERLRNLPPKEMLVVGMPFMDTMMERKQKLDEQRSDGQPHETTVLLAPSWGASGIFSLYGSRIIEALLATGYHVAIRPHPQSFKSELELMNKLQAQFPNSDQLEWNTDNDNFDVLSRADILISDFSGVIFDYALVFDRPVIYTEPSYDKAPYDACWLEEELWTFEVLPKIGLPLDPDSFDAMKDVIDSCLTSTEFQRGRDEARDDCWSHRGESAKLIVDYLIEKHEELVGTPADTDSYPLDGQKEADCTDFEADESGTEFKRGRHSAEK